MTKSRPVVVLSPKQKNIIRTTILVVPLSTTKPRIVHNYHLEVALPGDRIPLGLGRECWLKGDMIYALSMDRLNLYHFERDKDGGKRAYYTDRFPANQLFTIRKAVMHAIGLY